MHRSSVLALSILLAGCSLFSPEDPVLIRIANESDVDFDDVVVYFDSGREDYGPVPAGGVSEYRSIGKAYGYAPLDVRIEGDTLSLRIIDYVGEPLLRSGRYTYALGLTEPGDGARIPLSFSSRRDD